MKNTILGVILAYIIPHVSTDIWFIATWMMVGATVALALAARETTQEITRTRDWPQFRPVTSL